MTTVALTYENNRIPPGSTTLVTEADGTRYKISARRTADARTALQLALKDYLNQLSINFGGREVRFKHVRTTWAEPEENAEYPSAAMWSDDAGTFDPDGNEKLSPGQLGRENEIEGLPGTYWSCPYEFVQLLNLQVWTTDPKERVAIASMLEDAFNPVRFMYGFRLRIPYYHNVAAEYEPLTMTFEENEDDSRRRFRKITYTIRCRIPMIRIFGNIPQVKDGSIRVGLEVQEGFEELTNPDDTLDPGCRPVVVVDIPPPAIPPGSGIPINPGGCCDAFTFVQTTPLATWIINHNLGYEPSIEVRNQSGQVVLVDVLHSSLNQSIIYAVVPFAGTARCV